METFGPRTKCMILEKKKKRPHPGNVFIIAQGKIYETKEASRISHS
jgi:hypothetical protein